MSTEQKHYGPSFRQARERAGLSQNAASRASGVTVSAISMCEAGQRVPSVFTAWRLADAYGCTVDELIGRDKAPADIQVTIRGAKGLSADAVALLSSFLAWALGSGRTGKAS